MHTVKMTTCDVKERFLGHSDVRERFLGNSDVKERFLGVKIDTDGTAKNI